MGGTESKSASDITKDVVSNGKFNHSLKKYNEENSSVEEFTQAPP
eukprot:gene21023-7866_t